MSEIKWYTELANELKTVLDGAEHEAPKITIEGIIETLESGQAEKAQIVSRLKDCRLGWFADRLESNVFHSREQV